MNAVKELLCCLLGCLLAMKSSGAVILEAVVVPHSKSRGEEAHLLCKYLEDGYDSLYSLKWYKDEVEFYRYQPWNAAAQQQVFDVPGVRVDLSSSKPSHIVLKKVNFRSTGIYRCEITSSSFEITEKYEQMTIIELPHKAPTITTDLNIKQYEIGDMLQLNCTSEPSHPASHLKWEVNKQPVEEDNYIFNEIQHEGKKLYVTRIGLRIRLTKYHFHWGKLKVACLGEVKAVFWAKGVENIYFEDPETHYQVLESMEGYWIGNGARRWEGLQIWTAVLALWAVRGY